MTPVAVSPQGIQFNAAHEGIVLRAYKDQGGVVTIGTGFTNGSRIFKAYWVALTGHPLQMGDKITPQQCEEVQRRILDVEIVPSVLASVAPQNQWELDGAADVAYNAGNGALKWQWAVLLRARDVAGSVAKLAVTALTAARVVRPGLINRRRDECKLIQLGDYGVPGQEPSITNAGDAMRAVQKDLATLGYYKGSIDGLKGNLTLGAIKNFQRAEGLLVDGRVGPATRSRIAAAIDRKTRGTASISTGTGAGGIGLLGVHLDNPWMLVVGVLGVVIVTYLAFLVWHNRGVITGKRTPA